MNLLFQRKYEISKSQRNDFHTTYFKDGKRKIDYVLTYECNDMNAEEESSSGNDVSITLKLIIFIIDSRLSSCFIFLGGISVIS